MNKKGESKSSQGFPKDWKPIACVPKEFLQDCGDIKLEFIDKLTPELLAEITKDKEIRFIKLISDD